MRSQRHKNGAMILTPSLADPSGSSVFLGAVQWIEGVLLGTVATTVAVLAVASVGFMALAGRMSVRRAATVVCGCFVVFGASSIAGGIHAAVRSAGGDQDLPRLTDAPPSPLRDLPKPPSGYDPYAGASVPPR
jgi:type IV secretion system protein VirB2